MPLPTMRTALVGDIDKVFDRFWSDWNLPMSVELPTAPSVDVYEKNATFVIELAVPSYKPEDVDVELSGNAVTIVGKFDTTTKTEDAKYHRREIRRGAFERTVTLPLELDPATVTAKIERGILYVEAKPMKTAANTKVKVTSA